MYLVPCRTPSVLHVYHSVYRFIISSCFAIFCISTPLPLRGRCKLFSVDTLHLTFSVVAHFPSHAYVSSYTNIHTFNLEGLLNRGDKMVLVSFCSKDGVFQMEYFFLKYNLKIRLLIRLLYFPCNFDNVT